MTPLQLALLTTASQLVAWIVTLCLSVPVLSDDLRDVLRGFPEALWYSFSLHGPTRRAGERYIAEASAYLGSDTGFVLWLWWAFLAATFVVLALHMLVTGSRSLARYAVGLLACLAVASLVYVLCSAFGTGYPVALGAALLIGQVVGWGVCADPRTPDDRMTDARTVRQEIGDTIEFDPLKYININPKRGILAELLRRRRPQGIFVGLTRERHPHHISLADARKHVQLLGDTRQGKTVAATLLLEQYARLGECVIVLDPKNDRHAPGVMKASAERAGVPFHFLDLRPDQPPQLSLLAGCRPDEIEELFISCFDLGSKGDMADVYRVKDRAAARTLARSGAATIADMVCFGAADETITGAVKFWADLEELAAHPAIQTRQGLNLAEVVGRPSVLYIVGSTRHDSTIRLQKIILLRLFQLIDRHGLQEHPAWIALFLDEFKYLLSPAALRALGTAADRCCHLIIAHQSLGDLRDCGDLDPKAVEGAVLVNTGLKLFYKTNDPDTARWGARLSGSIPAYTERLDKGLLASPHWGSWTEQQRPLYDENTLTALPPLTAVLMGAGLATQVSVHPLPASPRPEVVAAPAEEAPRPAEELI
jgi:hypothetical protein